jgi:hypothetical protein
LSIPIGTMTEISPKGFILGVKAENEIYHWLGPKIEKGYLSTWEANLQPLGSMLL